MTPELRQSIEDHRTVRGIVWRDGTLWRKGRGEARLPEEFTAWAERLPGDASPPSRDQFRETLEALAREAAEKQGPEGKDGQPARLVAFVQEHARLLRDGDGEVYALDDRTREVRRIRSDGFRDWLDGGFFQEHREPAKRQSVAEACDTLTGLGRESGRRVEVNIRTAQHGKAYFLDLGKPGSALAVWVTPGQWGIAGEGDEDALPVYFLRPSSMRPIDPPPVNGDGEAVARLASLWEIANIPEEFRVLVVAWLCECLRPDTPYPLLELTGEEGSAKSTTQKALRTLIDPNASLVDRPPKSEEDLVVSAADALVCSVENVSYLTPALQDSFCTLATGGGLKRRRLYSDADVVVVCVKRPVVLNGIAEVVTASDLVNRTVTLELPRLTGGHKEETSLWSDFVSRLEVTRGALLDIFARALEILPWVNLPPCDDDRLVSFMRLGVAVAEAMGKDGQAFLGPYLETRGAAGVRILEGTPVGAAVLAWIEANPEGGAYTPKEWGDRLTGETGECFEGAPSKKDVGWPKTPRALAAWFKRLAPALRRVGVECCTGASLGGPRGSQGNLWKITRGTAYIPRGASSGARKWSL